MKNSAMRYMCVISLIFGFLTCIYAMSLGMSSESIVLVASVFVVPAFAGKVAQKKIEIEK